MRTLSGGCLLLATALLINVNPASAAQRGMNAAARPGCPMRGAICQFTLANLQTAFNGESNAHARYLAFAEKADQEGYAGVASLFRAAARAESIHAANHAAVMKTAGVTPEAKIETPVVKSTVENLKAAIEGETYERDHMYPRFITQAQSVAESDAVRTFTFAKAAEAEHAKLYAEALRDFENRRTAQVYYVCPVCGFTTANLNFTNCPTCATPGEKYERVS